MTNIYRTLAFMALFAATPLVAQENPEEQPADPELAEEAPATEGENSSPATPPLSMGEPVNEAPQVGQPYVKETFGAWQLRCVKTENDRDPCQLYQLLKDEGGNSVAEFAIFPLTPPQGDAIAGGTIIAPLETLLPEGVRLQIDGGDVRRYPFTFCAQVGCFARVGYSADEIARFKAGNNAVVAVVPVVAADQRITLNVSLSGFTAGYNALDTLMKDLAAEIAAEEGNAENEASPESEN